ncbi:Lrp/AsnC family transcriptional regulator [Natrinema hispanicum]|uniref:DNA-binding Lrp family transcriptional regulator n=1 Tax=Natrinema hispanicum TaxID=392421 RepID=A0A1H9ZRN3_9EURY|nr:winged helix-turn-helix domain-containing protein [Natrinema hispanicum]RZV11245.1 DNA-binding Lrp family transcriptional regulator [Natrinema hispanicum]SDC06744.1 DNA-binding transcriptional regulator, Lrp family [Natrinema hispanicum]SES84296.1 DNA-binding transcriptional regulator, Lrp family [Natrinema hispanicum]
MSSDPPNWDFKDRDIAILTELADDPQLSSRELTTVLEDKYDIDVSHVTVSESIRRMRDEGVFREAIIPNEEYYIFALFEFKFNTEHFADHWRAAMEDIRADKHTLFFFLADGEYQWKTIMMFRDRQEVPKWIHDCYSKHGKVIENVRNSAVHNVLKFQTDPQIYEDLGKERSER